MRRPYRVLTRAEELGPVANAIMGAGILGLDIETYKHSGGSGLDPRRGEIRLLQLNIDDKDIVVIDAMQTQTLDPVVGAIKESKAIKIAHNAKFEQKWFWHKFRARLWPVFCTFRASALIHNGRKELKHDLWSLYRRELDLQQEANDFGDSDWSQPNLSQGQYDYAAEDVFYLHPLRERLKARLTNDGLLQTALIEFGVLLAEGDVECNGFPVDRERWLTLAQSNLKRAGEIKSQLLRELPHPKGQLALPGLEAGWNIDSNPQLTAALARAKIKVPDTQKLTLGMIAGKYPVVKKIMEYRKYAKQYSSFGPEWLKHVQSDGRVHADFYSLLAAGRYSCSKPNCFDGATEVLTRRGWSRFDALERGAAIAQWRDGRIEFVVPTAYIQQRYEGEMVHVENEHIDLFMTPDHRCLLQHRKTGELRVFPATEYKSDWRQLHAGLAWDGDLDFEEDRLILLLATQADGYWNGGGVDFSFTKLRKIKRIVGALERLGVPFSSAADVRGRQRIRILSGEFSSWLRESLGEEKRLPTWLLGLTRDRLDFVSDELMFWDGCWSRKSGYSSIIRHNADIAQAVLVISGRRANVREYNNEKWGGKNLNYQLDVTSRDYSLTTNAKISRVPWSGDVYCVSVPSSYILIRRCGKTAVTGQSQQIPKLVDFRNCFRAPEGKIFVLADYAAIEMRIVAEISGDPRLIAVFADGRDPHFATASLIMSKLVADISRAERNMAKPVNFGFIYGMMPAKLVLYALGNYGVAMTPRQAETFRNKFFDVDAGYYGIKRWHERVLRDGARSGVSRTMSGRIRYLDSDAHNEHLNTPVQGTGADGLKLALPGVHTRIQRYGDAMQMVHHVHDEIILECDDDPEVEKEAKVILEEEMVTAMQRFLKKVPVVVEASSGPSWGEAKS